MCKREVKGIDLIVFLAMAILLHFCSLSYAEGDSGGAEIDSYVRFMPSRSVDAMPGGVEIIEAAAEYSYEFKVFDKLPVKFALGKQYLGIENTTAVELPAHLMGLTTDIETTLPFFGLEKTYLRLGLSPSFYGDDWDFSASDFRIPMRAFAIYLPDEQWTFLAGLAVYPDFESKVLPILGFIYKPNDRLTFNIIPKRPNISYLLNDRVTLFAEGGGSFSGEFEVDKDNLEDVVLRYKETHLGGGIKYKINPHIEGSLSMGGVFGRSLQYEDSLGKVNIKDSFYTEFRLQLQI